MEFGQELSACRSQENGVPFSWDLKLDVPLLVESISFQVDGLVENISFQVNGVLMEFGQMLSAGILLEARRPPANRKYQFSG